MYSIKEISNLLKITPQAIYKQKEKLISDGYMYDDEIKGWQITAEGYNYLRDKQIVRVANQGCKPVEQPIENQEAEHQSASSVEPLNLLISQFKEQISTLQNQLKEEQAQKEYFKAKFEEKDQLLNQYLNVHMLPPAQEEEEKKTGFFQRIFWNKHK